MPTRFPDLSIGNQDVYTIHVDVLEPLPEEKLKTIPWWTFLIILLICIIIVEI